MSKVLKYSHQSFSGMNSVLDIILIDVSDKTANDISSRIQYEINKLELLLNRFNSKSETYHINDNAFNNWVKVSDELWAILVECKTYNELTLGYFNAGLGRLKDMNSQNPNFLIKDRSTHKNLSFELDINSKKVRYVNRYVSLDFGAIGKGLLLNQVCKIITEQGIKNCFVSFGGSSVLTKGKHPSGDCWPFTFRGAKSNPIVFNLNDHAVSISRTCPGNGEKHHIFNPNNPYHESTNRLVYVQDSCPIRSEVLSTALIVAAENDFNNLICSLKPQKVFVFTQGNTNKLTCIYKYENQ